MNGVYNTPPVVPTTSESRLIALARTSSNATAQTIRPPRARSALSIIGGIAIKSMSTHTASGRPAPDAVLTDMADYVFSHPISSPQAYVSARYCLLDALGRA